MKYEGSSLQLMEKIGRFSGELAGVFTFSDLWNLIGLPSSDRTAKVVNRLVRDGILFKVRRGLYITKEADLWVLACRLKKKACISLDSVLAKNLLIGTVPTKSVSVVFPGNTQTVSTPIGRIRYFKIKRELLFGILRKSNGVIAADSEKAYLDLLYYHTKGARFVVDPLVDVDRHKLDEKKIRRYLKHYRNPKFRKFVEGIIDEK